MSVQTLLHYYWINCLTLFITGGMFEYVSGANFFGEILEWCGYALATWSLPTFSFALFTMCSIGPRAYHHHRYWQLQPQEPSVISSCSYTHVHWYWYNYRSFSKALSMDCLVCMVVGFLQSDTLLFQVLPREVWRLPSVEESCDTFHIIRTANQRSLNKWTDLAKIISHDIGIYWTLKCLSYIALFYGAHLTRL